MTGSKRIMKKITSYIRSEGALVLKEQLREIGIRAITIADVTAWTSSGELRHNQEEFQYHDDLVHMTKNRSPYSR